jgi:hypothetical protein
LTPLSFFSYIVPNSCCCNPTTGFPVVSPCILSVLAFPTSSYPKSFSSCSSSSLPACSHAHLIFCIQITPLYFINLSSLPVFTYRLGSQRSFYFSMTGELLLRLWKHVIFL